MRIAVIIVTFNAQDRIAECMDSVIRQTYPKDKFKVFIIENHSSDKTLEIIKSSYPDIDLTVNDTNTGFAIGNNIGIMKAIKENFDYVVLLNDDAVVKSDWLEKLAENAVSEQIIGSVQSLVLLYSDNKKINTTGGAMHYLGYGYCNNYMDNIDEVSKLPSENAYSSGVSVLYKCDVLKKVGIFDDKFFMYHEDFDLGWKIRLAGYKNVLEPESICYHKYSFSKSIKKYYWMERNRLIVIFSNYKLATLFIIFPALLAMELGTFTFSLIGGWGKEKIRVYVYFLKPSSWKHISERRKFIKSIRTVKDRKILMLFTGKILFQDISNPVLTYIANPLFNLYFKLIKYIIIW